MNVKECIKKYNIKKITILYNSNYKNGVECVDFDVDLLSEKELKQETTRYFTDEFNRQCVVI